MKFLKIDLKPWQPPVSSAEAVAIIWALPTALELMRDIFPDVRIVERGKRYFKISGPTESVKQVASRYADIQYAALGCGARIVGDAIDIRYVPKSALEAMAKGVPMRDIISHFSEGE